MVEKGALLGQKISARSFYNRLAEAVVKGSGNTTRERYTQLVSDIAKADTLIQSITIAKKGIISAIYPVEGLESVLGINLLTLPERKNMLQNLVRDGKTITIDRPK